MHEKPTRTLGQGQGKMQQRVRLQSLQNNLNDAHHHMGELLNENRLLRTIHKRQDSALQRYEGAGAELPQLLNSHAEEVRMWQVRYRNLQSQNREMGNKLKQKDTKLLSLTDQNCHLSQLNIDKNLKERDELSERVRHLEKQVAEKDDELRVLHRRLQLDTKALKQQISNGISKERELMEKLDKANGEILKIGEIIRTEDISAKNSSKVVRRNYSQQSSDAFPLIKSHMADKSHRAKPLGQSTKTRNSVMDFTDIKYPTTNAAKSYLKNSSSMDSSETVHSPTQYDDDVDSTATTSETNEVNTIDIVESIDDTTIGDYNFGQTYTDQRDVDDIKRNDDIEKLRKIVQDEIVGNESCSDQFCETLSKDVKNASRDVKTLKISKDVKVSKYAKVSKDVKAGMEKARAHGEASRVATKKNFWHKSQQLMGSNKKLPKFLWCSKLIIQK